MSLFKQEDIKVNKLGHDNGENWDHLLITH